MRIIIINDDYYSYNIKTLKIKFRDLFFYLSKNFFAFCLPTFNQVKN